MTALTLKLAEPMREGFPQPVAPAIARWASLIQFWGILLEPTRELTVVLPLRDRKASLTTSDY